MKRIAFLCDWGESSASILNRYKRQTPRNSGIWKSVTGTDDYLDCDLVVVLGGTQHNIDKSKALLIHREPDFIRLPVTEGYEFSLTWQQAFCGVTWWLSSSYDELIEMEYPKKEQSVSCIVSGKHVHRNAFVKNLVLKKRIFPLAPKSIVDLYGRNLDSLGFGESYKGTIESNGNCKLDGLLPYHYSVVLENSQQKNYWTEKLADAILAWCVPLYLGCPNIDDFFDLQSIFIINEQTSYQDLQKIVNQPPSTRSLLALKEMRLKILNEFNISNVISNQVDSIT